MGAESRHRLTGMEIGEMLMFFENVYSDMLPGQMAGAIRGTTINQMMWLL